MEQTWKINTPSGPETVGAASEAEAIEKAKRIYQSRQTQQSGSEEEISSAPTPYTGPAGWEPATDANGNHVRIQLNPNLTEDDAPWLGAGGGIPSNRYEMPGDELNGGYISTPPSGYWAEVRQNLPGSAKNLARTGARLVQGLAYPPQLASDIFEMSKTLYNEPEAREQLGTYLLNSTDPFGAWSGGWPENFKNDPAGFGFDVLTSFFPWSKAGRAAGITGAAATPPVPSKIRILDTEELRKGSGAVMQAAKESEVYFMPEFAQELQTTLKTLYSKRGFKKGSDGERFLREAMEEVEGRGGRPITFDDLQRLSVSLNDAWLTASKQSSSKSSPATIAGKMRGAVNEFIANVEKSGGEGVVGVGNMTPDEASRMFLKGKAGYRQAMFARELETMLDIARVDSAQFAASGMGNTLTREIRKVLRQHYRRGDKGLSDAEVEILESINEGGLSQKAAREVARKMSTAIGTGIGLGAEYGLTSIGMPTFGAASAVGGITGAALQFGGKKAFEAIAVHKFAKFVEDVRLKGTENLAEALGPKLFKDIYGTPTGAKQIDGWAKKLGTNLSKSAAKELAVGIAASLRMTSEDAVDDIYGRLIELEDDALKDTPIQEDEE